MGKQAVDLLLCDVILSEAKNPGASVCFFIRPSQLQRKIYIEVEQVKNETSHCWLARNNPLEFR